MNSLADLFFPTFDMWDKVVDEVTEGKPELVDFHDDWLVWVITAQKKAMKA